jgi:peroxiredoxin
MVKGYNPEGTHGLVMGMKAPDFSLKEVEGKRFHLQEELEKQPVLLNFFRGHF